MLAPTWPRAETAPPGAPAGPGPSPPTAPLATPGPSALLPRSIGRDATLHFVLNGAAGSQDDEPLLAAIASIAGAAGRPFQMHRAATPERLQAVAEAAARAAGDGGVVVGVGGDGTINTVASALIGTQVSLGLVPRGTFNYFARVHGIPLEPEPAIRLLLAAQAHPVQVGSVNGRPFLVNASLGMYPELLEDREAFKQRFGRTRWVAFGAALRSLLLRSHRRLPLRVEADGAAPRDIGVSTLFVGNNRLQLEQLGLTEAHATGDTMLTALALRMVHPGELLWLAARGAMGRLGDADDLSHFSLRRLTVQPRLHGGRRRIKVAIDGEVTQLAVPLAFEIDPRPLWLLKAPAGDAEAGAA